jgi:2'-5' RNA ligase
MHLTIKFLGDVKTADIPAVCGAVAEAVRESKPFEFEVRGAGAFPRPQRPSVLWMGSGQGAEQMIALAEGIEAALKKLGFPREHRPFTPHLTLGRIRRPGAALAELARLIQHNADFQAGRTMVNGVVVFSSDLRPTGAVYTVLGRAALGSVQRSAFSSQQQDLPP